MQILDSVDSFTQVHDEQEIVIQFQFI